MFFFSDTNVLCFNFLCLLFSVQINDVIDMWELNFWCDEQEEKNKLTFSRSIV